MKRYKLGLITASLALALMIGCKAKEHEQDTGGAEAPTAAEQPSSAAAESPAPAMTATLQGAPSDTDFSGTVTLTPDGTGVRIVADISGVDTDGLHGINVHENGMCDHGEGDKHFTSAGGHFNPAGAEHACPPT